MKAPNGWLSIGLLGLIALFLVFLMGAIMDKASAEDVRLLSSRVGNYENVMREMASDIARMRGIMEGSAKERREE